MTLNGNSDETNGYNSVIKNGVASNANLVKSVIPPIGSVVRFSKTISGIPSLPDGWVECIGQTLSDSDSPLNGQVINVERIPGLFSHYNFEETSGNLIDMVTNTGNDAVNTGVTQNQTGKIGQCYYYPQSGSGTGTVVTLNKTPPINNCTYSLWAKIQVGNNSGGTNKNNPNIMNLVCVGSTNLSLWCHSTPGGNTNTVKVTYGSLTSNTGITFDDTWHHFVMVVSGDTLSIYVDGAYNTSGVTTATIGMPTDLLIGCGTAAGDNMFKGYIDLFSVYDRQLSAKEISDLYNSGSGKIPVWESQIMRVK